MTYQNINVHFPTKNYRTYEHKNKQVPAKRLQKCRFLAIYTTPLDYLMTQKNPSFQQYKRRSKPVSIHILPLSQRVKSEKDAN